MLLLLLSLYSCHSKTKNEATTQDSTEVNATGPKESSSPLERTETFKAGGHTYVLSIKREADHALPRAMVKKFTRTSLPRPISTAI